MVPANAVIVSADPEAQQALSSLLDTCGLAPITASTVREVEGTWLMGR